jgi:hypothetical protein
MFEDLDPRWRTIVSVVLVGIAIAFASVGLQQIGGCGSQPGWTWIGLGLVPIGIWLWCGYDSMHEVSALLAALGILLAIFGPPLGELATCLGAPVPPP